MGILSTLKRDNPTGEWLTLGDYLREARHRETGALAAMGGALSAPLEEQKELVEAPEGRATLVELASDLRVPKAARLGAARCLLEAGVEPRMLGALFIGAGDLVTDPRLGSAARKLVEGGLPAALQLGGEVAQVSLAAGAFARALHSASSAVGQARAKELVAGAPPGHAGAAAGLFAMGQGELPADQLEAWKKLLEATCAANRRAPAAAKRMGMAPPWPPNLPEAFAPLLREAEKKNEGIQAADAVANPALLKKAPPLPTAPSARAQRTASTPAPPPQTPDAAGKTRAPEIRRSPFRRSIGSLVEVPTSTPRKPMEEVKGRATNQPVPAPTRPHIEPKEDAPLLHKVQPMPMAKLPAREVEQMRFDPRGKKIPRPDRWRDDAFEWELPILPSSEMPPPMRAAVVPGPFTQRLQSILDDRPEAVDRLCAAAEARAAVRGEERLLQELSGELARPKWKDARAPKEQLARLEAIEVDERQPASWRAVARLLIERLSPA
jgi:hypothetical protein